MGPTQPPNQWAPWTRSLRVKLPGREADHLRDGPITPLPNTSPQHDAYLNTVTTLALPILHSWQD